VSRGTPSNQALIEQAERLIEAAGSKVAAHRLIDSVETKGKRGRPPGSLPYREVDQRLILWSVALRLEWMSRDCKRPIPTSRALLKRIVEACWKDDGVSIAGVREGRWDLEACANLAFVTLDGKELIPLPLGRNPEAVMERLDTRPKLDADIRNGRVVAIRFDRPADGGPESLWHNPVLGIWPTPEAWEAVHRLRPELHLLPIGQPIRKN
jgi:hypothetical protein